MADVTEMTGESPVEVNSVEDEENTMSSIPSNEDSLLQAPEGDSASIQSASNADQPEKPKIFRPFQETLHIPVTPADIIEYEWPLKSGDRFFLQEQIAEMLDVKSFKRKYAEMTRRIVEVPEKEYLQKTFAAFTKTIGEHQMHGMTALRSIEVHELMSAEYPSIYTEYQRASVIRIKAELAEKQKELDAIKNDKSKMEELRQKAMREVRDYNSDLIMGKKKYYWDLQTSIIQSSSSLWYRHPPRRSQPYKYPCAVIHGQFQQYYKKFTPSEMRRLPLSSVLDGHHLFPVVRPPSPPPIVVTDEDLHKMPSLASPGSPFLRGDAPDENVPRQDGSCALCGSLDEEVSPMLQCSSCSVKVHTDCIEMPDHIVEVAQSYAWNCIECKKCTICEKPDNEDKMMFCDRCDRGYHTFCVGLTQPPTGLWECDTFCAESRKKREREENADKGKQEPPRKRAKKEIMKKEPKDEVEKEDTSTPSTPATLTPKPEMESRSSTTKVPSSVLNATPVTTRRSARRAAATNE